MAVAGAPVTFIQGWNFKLEINGVAVAGFTEVTGMKIDMKVAEQMEGGAPSAVDKSNTTVSYPDITFKRGGSDNTELYDWVQNVVERRVQDKRDMSLVHMNGDIPIARWNIFQAIPKSYVPGDSNRSEEEKNLVEEMTVAVLKWKRVPV